MKINRRDFIKTGGMVMLGSLAAPSFLGSCTGNGTDQATGISFAQNHFGVSESDMKKVLAAALEKGGDYADLFFEHSYRNNIGLQDGAVNRLPPISISVWVYAYWPATRPVMRMWKT